eukprot:tig00000836_g4695.t1
MAGRRPRRAHEDAYEEAPQPPQPPMMGFLAPAPAATELPRRQPHGTEASLSFGPRPSWSCSRPGLLAVHRPNWSAATPGCFPSRSFDVRWPYDGSSRSGGGGDLSRALGVARLDFFGRPVGRTPSALAEAASRALHDDADAEPVPWESWAPLALPVLPLLFPDKGGPALREVRCFLLDLLGEERKEKFMRWWDKTYIEILEFMETMFGPEDPENEDRGAMYRIWPGPRATIFGRFLDYKADYIKKHGRPRPIRPPARPKRRAPWEKPRNPLPIPLPDWLVAELELDDGSFDNGIFADLKKEMDGPEVWEHRSMPNRFRIFCVMMITFVGAVFVLMRCAALCIWQKEFLSEKAILQQTTLVDRFEPRRTITDAVGQVLAMDEPCYDVYAHPRYFKKPAREIAGMLAPIVKRNPLELEIDLCQSRQSGILVARKIDEHQARDIALLRQEGIDLFQRNTRVYPHEEMAAEVVGYVNNDHKGQAGIEMSQQEVLLRRPRSDTGEVFIPPPPKPKKDDADRFKAVKAGSGALAPQTPLTVFATDKYTLRLHMDLRLQRAARKALIESMEKYSAKRGTVVVMDCHTGAIKALVTVPSYNPREFFKAPLELFKNWAVADLFEPGSTFKPINVAIALETGAIKPNDVFYDEGRMIIGGWPVENVDYRYDKSHRQLTVSNILERSSNVGMVHIMQRIAPKMYHKWLGKLGIGADMKTDLPGFSGSSVKPIPIFARYAIEPATAAFGQGFSLTPLKLVQLHAALANGGTLVQPRAVAGLVDDQGNTVWEPPRMPEQRIFSQETANTVVGFMEKVVERGTGRPCQIHGYRIAGKTGTAQKASPGGRYSAYVTSFVSIYPADKPRYVLMCMVDEPVGRDAFGSTVAIPVVKATLQTLINLESDAPVQNLGPDAKMVREVEAKVLDAAQKIPSPDGYDPLKPGSKPPPLPVPPSSVRFPQEPAIGGTVNGGPNPPVGVYGTRARIAPDSVPPPLPTPPTGPNPAQSRGPRPLWAPCLARLLDPRRSAARRCPAAPRRRSAPPGRWPLARRGVPAAAPSSPG